MIGQKLKLGFLASRNGSSLRAIVAAISAGTLDAEARLVVSNNRGAGALRFAQDVGVPIEVISTQADPEQADRRLCAELLAAGVELVVLSGYLRHLGPVTLGAFRNRILNIHPGPLPRFGGEGMYGARVHQAVIASGVNESAVTIHVVDEIYDNGPVIAAKAVPLEPGDTAESLEARVTQLEPRFFVETLQRLAAGAISLPT